MINISQITKSYNGKYKAVDNLNLEIKDGEIYGLLGPNGAGKTTTIKMITGIISPTSGNITINNIDIVECVKCGHQMREADKEDRDHVRKDEQVIGIFHPD